MILHFHIHYIPDEGQDICLNIVEGDEVTMCKKMDTGGDGEWRLEIRYEARSRTSIDYYYSVLEKGKVLRTEWMRPQGEGVKPAYPHCIPLSQKGLRSFTSYDKWLDEPIDAILFTEPFLCCLNKRTHVTPYSQPSSAILRIKVFAPQLRGNERLVLCGSHPVLGEWTPERGIPCFEVSPNEWVCDINTEYTANEDLEYKFVAVASPSHEVEAKYDGDKKAGTELRNVGKMPFPILSHLQGTGEVKDAPIPISMLSPVNRDGQGMVAAWETGYNRRLTVPRIKKGEMVQYCQRTAAFERPAPRMAGTVVSIRKSSDIASLPDIIEWMEDTHQQWLRVDTREITRSNYSKHLEAIGRTALSHHVVMECKVTSRCTPLSEWWDSDTERAKRYYSEVLGRRDSVPHPIPSWLAHDIMMRRLLDNDSMLCLFDYEDWQLLGNVNSIRVRDNIREMIEEAGRKY